RGGSDLTAIALAAALKADLCQIYTDVDGVYTADPRIVPTARKMDEISYDEMLELAGSGAKVMQLRSVEIAKKFGVVFEVRSSLSDQPGTIVKEETRSMEDIVVRGVALDKNQAKITLIGVPDRPGVAARVFRALADAAISVDVIVQNVSHAAGTAGPLTDVSFTVDKPDLAKARGVIEGLKQDVGILDVTSDESIGKLSIVGVGMRSHAGVAAKMFETLAAEGINISMISTSEIKVSVVIGLAQADQALRAVHKAFIG
ncbi:MAG: aspartate kinase, partial [Vicinamibacterales bacterium]